MQTNFDIRVCASGTAGEPLDSPAIRPAFAASGSEYWRSSGAFQTIPAHSSGQGFAIHIECLPSPPRARARPEQCWWGRRLLVLCLACWTGATWRGFCASSSWACPRWDCVWPPGRHREV